jgi:hypothetical protein
MNVTKVTGAWELQFLKVTEVLISFIVYVAAVVVVVIS